jgi:hypothetical protein
MEVIIMKKLFTQLTFGKSEKIDKNLLKAELESARTQLEWALRF